MASEENRHHSCGQKGPIDRNLKVNEILSGTWLSRASSTAVHEAHVPPTSTTGDPFFLEMKNSFEFPPLSSSNSSPQNQI